MAATKTALEWYERYMAESPRGTYAAQALGRQMILVHKLRGAAAARPIATRVSGALPGRPLRRAGEEAAAGLAGGRPVPAFRYARLREISSA